MSTLKLEIGSPAESGIGNCIISPTDDSDHAYFTLIGCGSNDAQNALAEDIVARFNAATPEATAINAVGSLVERLKLAVITACNDDMSAPGTRERQRHLERTDAMREAAAEIERLTSALAARTEECAKVADGYAAQFPAYPEFDQLHNAGVDVAAAIRAAFPAPPAAAIRSLQEQE